MIIVDNDTLTFTLIKYNKKKSNQNQKNQIIKKYFYKIITDVLNVNVKMLMYFYRNICRRNLFSHNYII